MAKSNNLQDLYNQWIKACTQTVQEVVPSVMKEKMKELIEYEVYAQYTPTTYERRREDGGLLDENNMIHRIDIEGNRVIVTLYNNTLGNDSYKYHSNDYIDTIIVTGEGYTWKNSNIYNNPIARDFYTETERLLEDGEIRMKIISKLRSLGVLVK